MKLAQVKLAQLKSFGGVLASALVMLLSGCNGSGRGAVSGADEGDASADGFTRFADGGDLICVDWGGNVNHCGGPYPPAGTYSCEPQPLGAPGCQGAPGQPASEATASYPNGCLRYNGFCNVYYPCYVDAYACASDGQGGGVWLIGL